MNRAATLLAVAVLSIGLRSQAQTVLPSDVATEPRLRLVPQSTDSIIADMEESPDGTRLITHDRQFAPRLWDAKTFRLLRILGGAQDPISQVRFSRSGAFILTQGTEEIRTWDAKKARLIARYPAPEGAFFVESQFSPDGTMIATGTSKGSVLIISVQTGKLIKHFSGLETYVAGLDWSEDSKFIGAGSGSTVASWNITSGAKADFKDSELQSVRSIDINQAGTLMVVSNGMRGAVVFDMKSGKALYRLAHVIGDRNEAFRSMAGAQFVGAKNESVLYFEKSGDIVLVEAATGREQKRLKGHTEPIDEIRLNRDRTRAGTHGDDERVLLWDLTKGERTPFSLRPGDRPTGAAFGSQKDDWYLGLQNGEIRKYDIKTGAETSGTLGATTSLARIRFLSTGRLLAVSKGATGSIFLDNLSESKFLVLPPRNQDASIYQFTEELYSDSGRYNIADTGGNVFISPIQFEAFDLFTGDGLWKSNAEDGEVAEFVPNSDFAMMTMRSGRVFCWDFTKGKEVYGVAFPDPKPGFTGAINGDGSIAVHGPYGADSFYAIWKLETGDILTSLEETDGLKIKSLQFSPSGKLIGGVGSDDVAVWDVATGKRLFAVKHGLDEDPTKVTFTRDGSRLVVQSVVGWCVVSSTDGHKFLAHDTPPRFLRDTDQRASADGKRLLDWGRNNLYVWDVDAGKIAATLELNDAVVSAVFSPNDNRILTVDLTDGIVIWDAKTLKRLGSLVQMRDGTWLVMDTEGRYDATDPNDVNGALYVMEWEGGLEALDVAQFKGFFWDPGLLQKLLGTSKEKKRDVPSLASLKLYPEASLKLDEKGSVTIGLEARDDGGIGRVVVSVNGKEILTKAGVGYFKVSAEDLKPYLLPENRLTKGQGNIVSVRASNSEGTLTSLPVTLDIGVPSGLKAPDVKLYALFVGAGDYVGQSRDLKAPPRDAEDLAKAVIKVSGGFLSNRVSVTELTTDSTDDKRPTRANVLKWFDDTAKQATSSDIVMVFFAGHGMDKLGSKTGYFFLTSEANPDSLTEANLNSVSVSGEDLRTKLKAIAANKQIVILDTCHSGAAAGNLVDGGERSVSGDYQRAWESIKDATGTWMLAGAAADQLSYESSNVDHGMLTYALLEAIDKANSDGLRPGQGGELFVDIERWLNYAANRVESLKNEVGLKGIQRPEFKRSAGGGSFDIGVLNEKDRGSLGLRPPLPVVIVGPFELDQEDPENLEDPIRDALGDSNKIKAWLDVSKHPNVYRIAGEYTVTGNKITVKVFIQRFDANQKRTTVKTLEVAGDKGKAAALATAIRSAVEQEIALLEAARLAPQS